MPSNDRSIDDQPLAAYSRGTIEPLEEIADTAAVGSPAELPPTAGNPAAADPPAVGAPPDEPPTVVVRGDKPVRPSLSELARDPRAHVRDPRLLGIAAGAVVVLLIGVNLVGGGPASGAPAAGASPTAPAAAIAQPDPPTATLELTGGLKESHTFDAMSGDGSGAAAAMAASWADSAGASLTLTGPVQRGTRTTDAGFTLSLSLQVNGQPATFLSKAGECTVGMAVTGATISGTFTCPKLKSADGKVTVRASGSYRT